MYPARREISLGFTTDRIHEGTHICYIFRDEDERQRTIAKYLHSGIEAGEKVLCMVDTMSPGAFVDCISELGFKMPVSGQGFVTSEAAKAYCPYGHFSPDEMLDVVSDFYGQALSEGYTGARGTGEMTWALDGENVRLDELMEYEAKLTRVLETNPSTACCQYDARKFDGATIMDVLSVHPMMIVRGQVVRNPFFREPEAFISELHKRARN